MQYGIDTEGPFLQAEAEYQVLIPDIPQPISDDEVEELRQNINPLQDDDAYDINTYIKVCLFVTEKIE